MTDLFDRRGKKNSISSEQLELFAVSEETRDGGSLWDSFPAMERAEVVACLSCVLVKLARTPIVGAEEGTS